MTYVLIAEHSEVSNPGCTTERAWSYIAIYRALGIYICLVCVCVGVCVCVCVWGVCVCRCVCVCVCTHARACVCTHEPQIPPPHDHLSL